MKALIEKNFTLTLLFFYMLGLTLPGIEHIPTWSVALILAVVIFIACFKIECQDIIQINWSRFLVFYLTRFIGFPLILYYSFVGLFPVQALALFLLALLPPAAASPAMCSLFKGNVSLSFALLVIGNLLTPIVLSFMISLVVNQSITLNIQGIFITLVLSVILPFIIFLMMRRHQAIHAWTKNNGSFLSIFLIGLTITIAIAKHKTLIFTSPSTLILPLALNTAGFFIFYSLGWILAGKNNQKDKIAYALGSGANNISIGITIALLYFPSSISLFLVVGMIPWILALTPFKNWVKRSPQDVLPKELLLKKTKLSNNTFNN